MWKCKSPGTAKTIFEKKNPFEGFTFPNFKLTTKQHQTAWRLRKSDTQASGPDTGGNRTSPPRSSRGKDNGLFNKWGRDTWLCKHKRMKFDPHTTYKNSVWIQALNCDSVIDKTRGRKQAQFLRPGGGFTDTIPKA